MVIVSLAEPNGRALAFKQFKTDSPVVLMI